MKKVALLLTAFVLLANLSSSQALANGTEGKNGKVSWKSVGAGALSLIVWPGIGQIVNDQKDDKVVTHALLGLTGVFRIWSCYDGVRDRDGGVWKNRI